MEAWLLGQAKSLLHFYPPPLYYFVFANFLLCEVYRKPAWYIAHFYIVLKVIFDETLQQFLDSYLQFAPRYWKDLFHWTVFVVGCGKETFTYLLCGDPNIVLSPRKFEIRSCVLVQSLRNQSIIVLCTWVWFQTVCFNKFFSSLGTLMHQFFHQN